MKQFFICILFILAHSLFALCQLGEIHGKVTDQESGEGIPFADVSLMVNDSLLITKTDFDGYYLIKAIPPDNYKITVKYLGYVTTQIEQVPVKANEITMADIEMKEESFLLPYIKVLEINIPIIDQYKTTTGQVFKREDVRRRH